VARARNIKPSFFTNEQLADNCPLGRLLFIGLWTLADYKGDLEWKERTIKIQILPWDNCDAKQLAINLDKSGLIRFYSDGDRFFINIPNFEKHQNPHKNERQKGSDIPYYSEAARQVIDISTLTINPDKSGAIPERSQSDRADSLLLNPESRILNPESLPLNPSVSDEAPPSPPAEKKSAKIGTETKSGEAWNAYLDTYFSRYGAEPVRNARTIAQMAQLVDRLGKDDAPYVAAFYVHHQNSRYVASGHSVGMLLQDAEKLRTEWATGRKVTQTQARQADRTASNPFAGMLAAQGGR
jgi:hypothetical protein